MSKKIIIFGTGNIAEVAFYFLNKSDNYNVVAFTKEKEYIKDNEIKFDLPVVEFEILENIYDINEYYLFAPFGATNLNKFREKIYNKGKEKGFSFITYISQDAKVYTENIGENCFILENNVIQPYVTIGNNCVLWSGNHIGHHSKIEDHVFITSHVVISGNCNIKKYSYLGVNSTIKDSLIINESTVIGMSSCIIKNTESYNIYTGIPGKSIKECDDTFNF